MTFYDKIYSAGKDEKLCIITFIPIPSAAFTPQVRK